MKLHTPDYLVIICHGLHIRTVNKSTNPIDTLPHHLKFSHTILRLSHHLISSYHIQRIQSLAGLSLSQVDAPSFLAALSKTLTTALKLQVKVYPLTSSLLRRQLLAGISISYSFSVLSGLSSDAVITRLKTAIFSGLFLAALKSNTGNAVVGVSGLVILDFSPTSSPTEAPISKASGMCSLG